MVVLEACSFSNDMTKEIHKNSHSLVGSADPKTQKPSQQRNHVFLDLVKC